MVLRPSAVSRHKISARPSPSKSPAPATVHENLLTPVVSCCVLALPDNQIALRPSAVSRHKISVDPDRKSVVSGKSVSVRVDLGGRRLIKKKKKLNNEYITMSIKTQDPS